MREAKAEEEAQRQAMSSVRVEPVLVPITVSVGHSLLITISVLLAVSLQLAYHRSRNHLIEMNMPYEKRSLLRVLQDMTIRS